MLPTLGRPWLDRKRPSLGQAGIRVATRTVVCVYVCMCLGAGAPLPQKAWWSLQPLPQGIIEAYKNGDIVLATPPAWDAGSSWAPSSSPCPPSPPSVREGWGQGGVLGRVPSPGETGDQLLSEAFLDLKHSQVEQPGHRLGAEPWSYGRCAESFLPSTQVPGRFVRCCPGGFCYTTFQEAEGPL